IVATAVLGDRVAFADRSGDVATSWSGKGFVSPGFRVTALAFEPDGTLLLGGADGTVHEAGADNSIVQTGAPVLGLSTGGHRFLLRLPREVRVYTDSGELVSTIHTAAQHATLSPGGLGVATTKGEVAQLWDATTGELLHTLGGHAGHSSTITDVEFAPN